VGRNKFRRNMITHPYIKYGQAIIMTHFNLSNEEDISTDHIKYLLESCLDKFRLEPTGEFRGKTTARFDFVRKAEGKAENGSYLSPFILTNNDLFKEIEFLIEQNDFTKVEKVKKSHTSLTSDFTGYSARKFAKLTRRDLAFCCITSATSQKPSMYVQNGRNIYHVGIIPNFEKNEYYVNFINLFQTMNNDTEGLLYGTVYKEVNKKGEIKKEKPNRPKIFKGNFPNAPKSSSMGALAILGAIGFWARRAEQINWANDVLDSLKKTSIYMISDNKFETFSYNEYVVELAKPSTNTLNSIIDSLYFTILFNKGKRDKSQEKEKNNEHEYHKFDLFASRFLQLFNRSAFKDFLAFRAEYPNKLEELFKTYFIKMEKISPAVVQSAREFGKWINLVCYKIAQAETDGNNPEKLRERKAKALIEIESSILSARDGAMLIFQAITKLGRAYGLDAPHEAELFMSQTATGEISLENARHLLIAFSRVKNKYEPRKATVTTEMLEIVEENDNEDLSTAQE
jgi:hypothetical protein